MKVWLLATPNGSPVAASMTAAAVAVCEPVNGCVKYSSNSRWETRTICEIVAPVTVHEEMVVGSVGLLTSSRISVEKIARSTDCPRGETNRRTGVAMSKDAK